MNTRRTFVYSARLYACACTHRRKRESEYIYFMFAHRHLIGTTSQALVKQYDKDGNGTIDYREFAMCKLVSLPHNTRNLLLAPPFSLLIHLHLPV